EDVRPRSSFRESGFEDSVDTAVRQAGVVSVPRRGTRVAPADNLLALVVPEVEAELGVLGDHTLQEAGRTGRVVHELGPTLSPEPLCMWLMARPLRARREAKRHLRRRVSRTAVAMPSCANR